jgi:iron complex transport system ATP-binding protein
LLIAGGRTVATGSATETITTEHISVAFDHPVRVERQAGRWSARSRLPLPA